MTKRRRVSPVPAGSGIPGSIAGSPRPASADAPEMLGGGDVSAISRRSGRSRCSSFPLTAPAKPAPPLIDELRQAYAHAACSSGETAIR